MSGIEYILTLKDYYRLKVTPKYTSLMVTVCGWTLTLLMGIISTLTYVITSEYHICEAYY